MKGTRFSTGKLFAIVSPFLLLSPIQGGQPSGPSGAGCDTAGASELCYDNEHSECGWQLCTGEPICVGGSPWEGVAAGQYTDSPFDCWNARMIIVPGECFPSVINTPGWHSVTFELLQFCEMPFEEPPINAKSFFVTVPVLALPYVRAGHTSVGPPPPIPEPPPPPPAVSAESGVDFYGGANTYCDPCPHGTTDALSYLVGGTYHSSADDKCCAEVRGTMTGVVEVYAHARAMSSFPNSSSAQVSAATSIGGQSIVSLQVTVNSTGNNSPSVLGSISLAGASFSPSSFFGNNEFLLVQGVPFSFEDSGWSNHTPGYDYNFHKSGISTANALATRSSGGSIDTESSCKVTQGVSTHSMIPLWRPCQ